MNAILQGLLIIARHDPKADLRAEHDQIWVGDISLPLTPTERNQMDALGWFIDEEADGWSLHC